MARNLVEKINGQLTQVIDKVTGQQVDGQALRDLVAGDKLERTSGKVETVVSRTVTPDGFIIVQTQGG